jgi:N-acetylmuramoyl-L-alanine amidase CwlA
MRLRTQDKLWDTRPVLKVEKIVLHDPANDQSAQQVINYLNSPANKGCFGYHDIIQSDIIYHFTPYNLRATHAGAFYPTELWTRGRCGTQNAYSLGICIIRPGADWDFVGRHIGQLCAQYDLHPLDDVLCHFHLHETKTDPLYFYGQASKYRGWLESIIYKEIEL